MHSVDEKRQAIREIIEYYAQFPPSVGDIEMEVIFDEEKDHYELVETGWTGPYRIHGSTIHIDIRKGMVVIQHDGTPDSIADQLLEKCVAREDIVLAYKPPSIRPHTPFPTELPSYRAVDDQTFFVPGLTGGISASHSGISSGA